MVNESYKFDIEKGDDIYVDSYITRLIKNRK